MANRKHSKIDALPEDLKSAVEEMLLTGSTYSDIVQFLKDNEQSVSVAAVCRYARAFNANMEQLRMANENFKNMMDEINRYPELDTTEAIIRIASGNVFNRLANAEDADWDEVKLEKLLKETNGLIRATAYKKRIELQNKEIRDTAIDEMKGLMFQEMAKDNPDLYKSVVAYLNSKKNKE
ncbi:DUF3486 family protein [Coprobacillus sp. AF16-47]|jgi:hypothetical protein|nr:DUF3486 family protein [Coprobacillus sp. AF16-47]DAJ79461.1 MAG TPA: Protein of unknown function (DUF3486) [Caudoviricetes sp.]